MQPLTMLLQSESQEGCFWPYHFVGADSAFPYSSVGEVIKSFSTMDGLPNLVRVQVNSCPWAASETKYLPGIHYPKLQVQ